MTLLACGASVDKPDLPTELIRVGSQVITVGDFEDAFAISRMAYDAGDLKQPIIWREARLNLLNQLVEEALVLACARRQGIEMDPAEVDRFESRLREDQPQGALDAMLLEQAVRYSTWRERVRVRLLMEKTVQRILGARTVMDPKAIEGMATDLAEIDPTEDEEDFEKRLRRAQIEKAYPQWVRQLRQEYAIHINQPEWERILNTPPS